MAAEAPVSTVWRLERADEQQTSDLAREIAGFVGANDLVTLSGDLGSGKTTFARALIRRLLEQPDLEVPSPTFTLMQIYQGKQIPVVHADLFRIKDPSELAELGWDEAADGALLLVEWAERAGDSLPPDRLDIAWALDPAKAESWRAVTLTGHGSFAPRLALAKAIYDLLHRAGWLEAQRVHMIGDASVRAYQRLTAEDGRTAVLMIAPRRPDGPLLRFGKSYSELAHLAEDIRAFIAIDIGLRQQSIAVPKVIDYDLDAGIAILEDLGALGVTDENGPISERYVEATAVIAMLHGKTLPDTIHFAANETYAIPPYDLDAFLVEVELVLDWYAPHVGRQNLSSGARASFVSLWRTALEDVIASDQTWTLRDYHSPNLMWMPERMGLQRLGVIDFQDCARGPAAYDVVSLLQDARVTIGNELELRLLSFYARRRREADRGFDMARFAKDYAILGAQRATKILGIFARLNQRDGKPHYLAHLPRIQAYLAKNLAHPALAELTAWFEANLPQVFGIEQP